MGTPYARGFLVLSLAAVAAMYGGCGKSARSSDDGETRGGSSSGSAQSGTGGTRGGEGGAKGGSGPAGGGGHSTGGTDEGGAPSAGEGGAGAPECVDGAPCLCGERPGTLRCTEKGPRCACDPTDDCTLPRSECFEPCGGDPFGNWILEEACLSGSALGGDCVGGRIKGSTSATSLVLSLADGGELRVKGREAWNLDAEVPLSCLGIDSVDDCGQAQIFVGPTSPLIFSRSRAWLSTCAGNACGFCNCSGTAEERILPDYAAWSADGMRLTLSWGHVSTVPYCVAGDVLWIGGSGTNGEGKVSYKFRRQSCTGTPTPCEERTTAECTTAGWCDLGRCTDPSGTRPECAEASWEEYCGTLGCTWEPDGCTGTAQPSCDFVTCEEAPGCTLGPPVAPHCAGEAHCGGSDAVDDCDEPGCSIRTCAPTAYDEVSCENLGVGDWCEQAPGCTSEESRCAGTTLCSAQEDDGACYALGCLPFRYCGGRPERACSELSVESCHSLFNCRIEW